MQRINDVMTVPPFTGTFVVARAGLVQGSATILDAAGGLELTLSGTFAGLRLGTRPVSVYMPDARPVTGSPFDDEFDDAVLDSAWQEYDWVGNTVPVETALGLQLIGSFVSGKTHALGGVVRSAPTGTWAAAAKVAVSTRRSGDYRFGLIVGPNLSSAPMTAPSLTWGLMVGSAGIYLQALYYSNYATLVAAPVNFGTDKWLTEFYLRLRIAGPTSGSLYYCDWSSDGIGWVEQYEGNLPCNVNQVGFAHRWDFTGWVAECAAGWFRCTHDILPGRTVPGRRVMLAGL